MTMQALVNMLMSQLKADKGRDVNRTVVLCGVLYLVWQVSVLDKRIAVIEAAHAPRPAHLANSSATNDFATFERFP